MPIHAETTGQQFDAISQHHAVLLRFTSAELLSMLFSHRF